MPVVPVCIIGTAAYGRPASWLPIRRTRFGVAFGPPLRARADRGESESAAELLADIKRSYRELHAELLAAMAEDRPGLWHRLATREPQAGRPGHFVQIAETQAVNRHLILRLCACAFPVAVATAARADPGGKGRGDPPLLRQRHVDQPGLLRVSE